MPCSTARYRGFKHGQGHGRGQHCKRCILAGMTIPELLNHSNMCRAAQHPHNNCRKLRNCETYRRECIRSYSDDEPERLWIPNNAHDNNYECADTPLQPNVVKVLVRECTNPPPCRIPPPSPTLPLQEKPLASQTGSPCEKPPPCKTSPAISSTCSNSTIQCDDSYLEIPSSEPAGQYRYNKVLCKKPSICQRPATPRPVPWPRKTSAPCYKHTQPSSHITPLCTTTPPSETESIVICETDEDKICRRVSFGSVSELRSPPDRKGGSCGLDQVCSVEIPVCAVASTQVCPKPTQSCSTQNNLSYTCSEELQSDICVCNKGSTASMEVHTQTCSKSSITENACGAKDCPKSATAKCKHTKHCSNDKRQKKKEKLKCCDESDSPKSTSTIDNSLPNTISPSCSKEELKCPKCRKKKKKKQSPSSSPKSTPLTPSASNEITCESLHSNKSDVSEYGCTKKNEEKSLCNCNLHKKSTKPKKKCWFRKCKLKAKQKKENKVVPTKPADMHTCMEQRTEHALGVVEMPGECVSNRQPVQDKLKIKTEDPKQSCALGTSPTNACTQGQQILVPEGQNMCSQLPQIGQYPHGQFCTDGQSLQEQFVIAGPTSPGQFISHKQIPQGQFAASMQTSPEVTSLGAQIPATQFGPGGQMPQSQLPSSIQTRPGLSLQPIQTPLNNTFGSREQFPQGHCVPREQMLPRQFDSEIPTRPNVFSHSVQTSHMLQQTPHGQFAPREQMPQCQFASEIPTRSNILSQSVQTPQILHQNPHGQFAPGEQMPQRQFASEIQTQVNLSSQNTQKPQIVQQNPQGRFISGGQFPLAQYTSGAQIQPHRFAPGGPILQHHLSPGGQIPQNYFASSGQIPQGKFSGGHHPQSHFTPGGQYPTSQFEQIPEREYVPAAYTPQSKFSPSGQNIQGQFAPGQIPQSQFAPSGQYPINVFNPREQIQPGEFLPAGYTPQSKITPHGLNQQDPFSLQTQTPPQRFPQDLSQNIAVKTQFTPSSMILGGQFPQNQYIPNDQTLSNHFIPDRLHGETFPKQQIMPGQFTAGFGGLTQSHFATGTSIPGGDYPSPDNFSRGMPLHLQEQTQCYPGGPGKFAPGGSIPSTQSALGSQMPSNQTPLGGQMLQSQSVLKGPQPTRVSFSVGEGLSTQYTTTKMPQDQVVPEVSIRPELASQVERPPDQFTLRNLGNTDQSTPRGQNWNGIIHKPTLSSLSPLAEMPQYQLEQAHNYQGGPGFAPGGLIPPTQAVSGSQMPSSQAAFGYKMSPRQSVSGGPIPIRVPFSADKSPSNQYTPTTIPQDHIEPEGQKLQELASQVGQPPDQFVLENLGNTDQGATRDQTGYGIIQKPSISGQSASKEVGQHLHQQVQNRPVEPEQFVLGGLIPPSQSVSGGKIPVKEVPLGDQMSASQAVSGSSIPIKESFSGRWVQSNQYTPTKTTQDEIDPPGTNRQELASQVRMLPEDVARNLEKTDQRTSGEMSQRQLKQAQNYLGELGQFGPRGSSPPTQAASGSQMPSSQVPFEGQMTPNQSVSGSPIQEKASGRLVPPNQYASRKLSQQQIGAEGSYRPELSLQVGTPSDKFILGSIEKADQGATRDQTGYGIKHTPCAPGQCSPKGVCLLGQVASGGQIVSSLSNTGDQMQKQQGAPSDQNWYKILLTPCGSEGKVITANISPCGSLITLCKCAKITCNCSNLECRNKCKCTCSCNNKENAPKYCQHACVQCSKRVEISPMQSVSAVLSPVQLGDLAKRDHDAEARTQIDQIALEHLDTEDRINLKPCGNTGNIPCNCADIICKCSNLESRGKCTSTNTKKDSKYCQDACVQCRRTWCLQNLIVNTSLYEFHHPNTVAAVEAPKVSSNLSANLERNAYCECHYPPMFRHLQCTGNMCGICKCREIQH